MEFIQMNFTRLQQPSDLKTLSNDELKELASFCRELILKRTSVYGGHVGPDLGVVEATIALCKVFDFPADKIVWDVSHQVDTWKMLTGRMEAFTKPNSAILISEAFCGTYKGISDCLGTAYLSRTLHSNYSH